MDVVEAADLGPVSTQSRPTDPLVSVVLPEEVLPGDVVLSNSTLNDVVSLMSYRTMYTSLQTWLLSRRIALLASFMEAFVTRNRVLFCTFGAPEEVRKNVAQQNFLRFELNIVPISVPEEPRQIQHLITASGDATACAAYLDYLQHLPGAEEEWSNWIKLISPALGEAFSKLMGKDIQVKSETWDEMMEASVTDLCLTLALLPEKRLSFWANPIEGSFCSSASLTDLSARTAVRSVEHARWLHAERNNALVGQRVFEYQVPFVFGAVLRQSTSWDDLFTVAKQMRDTQEAKAFREWSTLLKPDLIDFRRHFRDVEVLANDLGKAVDAREKSALRMEASSDTQLEKPYIVFLQKLFEWNRAILNIDSELQRVLYAETPNVALGEKIRHWTRGCSFSVTANGVQVKMNDLNPNPGSSADTTGGGAGLRYETHIYGPVFGSVHTGSGDINEGRTP